MKLEWRSDQSCEELRFQNKDLLWYEQGKRVVCLEHSWKGTDWRDWEERLSPFCCNRSIIHFGFVAAFPFEESSRLLCQIVQLSQLSTTHAPERFDDGVKSFIIDVLWSMYLSFNHHQDNMLAKPLWFDTALLSVLGLFGSCSEPFTTSLFRLRLPFAASWDRCFNDERWKLHHSWCCSRRRRVSPFSKK